MIPAVPDFPATVSSSPFMERSSSVHSVHHVSVRLASMIRFSDVKLLIAFYYPVSSHNGGDRSKRSS